MKFKEIRLVLGDQLNINHPWFQSVDSSVLYVLMEVKSESEYVTHHIQKVVSIFAAMRAFATQLQQNGHHVRYFKINDADNQQDFIKNLSNLYEEHKPVSMRYQLPDEYRLDAYFNAAVLPLTSVDSAHFLTSREELSELFRGKKTFLMETFYRHMRKKHAVLMEGDQPAGGQWNYDHENRKKLPAKAEILTTALGVTDQTTVYEDINRLNLKPSEQLMRLISRGP